jgi:hypothetical protein
MDTALACEGTGPPAFLLMEVRLKSLFKTKVYASKLT